jgi:dTDP-4-dehydrorhamnose reductase
MEILIFGAGLVGSALGELAPERAVVTTSKDGDLRQPDQVRALVERHRPKWIVLSAAISGVDQCERDPQLAHDVNVGGARHVAEAARDAGARLVFLSTDYVFDGEASQPYDTHAPRRAVNVYAATKIAGEDEVRSILPDAAIARTSWVFGIHRACYATDAVQGAATRHELKVVTDKYICPTYNRDLAQMLLALIDRGVSGVFHCVNPGPANWLDFSRPLIETAGIEDVRFLPTTLAEHYKVRRPHYTALSAASMERIGIQPRTWRETFPDFIAEMRRRGMIPQSR